MKTTITASDSLRLKRRDRTVLAVATMSLMAMAAVLGAAAALMVPAGLPYDEPSHWSTVMYFAERWTLPVLGAPGVTYEGQQTPLYYIIAAALAGVTADSAFMAVRLFGVLGHALLVGLTAVILRETIRDGNLVVVIAGAAFIALNPMLIVMSASVQNDTWALVWGLAAIAVVLLTRATNRTWVSGILVGILASLSVLTKLSMAPLAIAIVAAYVIRRQIVQAVVVSGVVAAATGWWLVRNLVLYGDLTGQSAVARTGAVFTNTPIDPVYVGRTVLTYLTLPTEYLRNTIAAPAWVDAAALLVGLIILTGLVLLFTRYRRRCDGHSLLLLTIVALTSASAWLVQVVFGWPVAFRTAYGVFPLVALAVGAATQISRRRWVHIAVVCLTTVLQIITLVWVALAVRGAPDASMLLL